jgi:hypothetical protein
MSRRRRRREAAARPQPAPARPRRPVTGRRVRRRIVGLVRRRPVAVAAALVLLHVALALLSFQPQPHTGGDNGAYITLGRSLLEHGTYTELWEPAETAHTKYPPVFPLVLAIAMAFGLQPWVQLKLVVLALSAGGVAFSFLWLRARRRAALALGVGLLLAVAPGLMREGRWILSDVPFWAFTMVAVWAFERLRPDDWRRFAVAAGATLLAYFTRSAGLPLVLAALLWLAWRRAWAQFAALGAIIGIPALLWALRTRAHGPAGYVSEFWFVDPYIPALGTIGPADFMQRILENVHKYVALHLPILLTGSLGLVLTVVSALVVALALYGWLVRVRRPRVAELFLPLYLGLILIWPAIWSGERFLLPMLPLLLFYAGEGLVRLTQRYVPGRAFVVGGAAAALLLVLALPGLIGAARAGIACTTRYLEGERYPCLGSPMYDDFYALAEVSGEALPDGAVVMNRKPRLFYVLGGDVKGIIYPLSDDPDLFFAEAAAAGARYVVFDRLDAVSELYLRPVLARRARAFCLMRATPTTTTLFGILPDAAAVPDLTEAEIDPTGAIGFELCPSDYWRSAEARFRWEGA